MSTAVEQSGSWHTNTRELPHAGDDPATWPIGVIIAIVGTFCGSLGDNLVKLSYNTLQRLSKEEQGDRTAGRLLRSVYACLCCSLCVCRGGHSPVSHMQQARSDALFISGWFLNIVVNTTCSIGSMAFAPASLVTPFAGVHIFWNIWLARIVNSEPVSGRDYVSSSLIIVGVLLVLLFGAKETPAYPLDKLEAFFKDPVFLIAAGCGIAVLGVLLYGRTRGQRAKRICLAATAGVLGAFANPLLKTLVEILRDASLGQGVFMVWNTYFFLFLTLGLAVAQLYFLNQGLAMFEAYAICPIYLSILGVLGTIVSVILYQEYPQYGTQEYCGIGTGLLLVGCGIMLLNGRDVWHPAASGSTRGEEDADDERSLLEMGADPRRLSGGVDSSTSPSGKAEDSVEPEYQAVPSTTLQGRAHSQAS
jgi:drug/metabolite transporter (DMT)-like permease